MSLVIKGKLRIATITALSSALILAACGDGDMDHDGDMRRDVDTVNEHVSILSRELELHASAVAGAMDVAEARTIEAAHEASRTEHMRTMDHAALDMKQYCHRTSTPAQLSTQEMDRAMAAMHDEDERHRSSIGAVSDAAAAQNEERRHQETMRALVATLRSSLEVMRADVGWWRCNPMNHGS